jgi:GT2 family glycosyltransferase
LVAHDSAAQLPITLADLTAQLAPGDELIVVDNASSDESAAIARTCAPRATVLELDTNLGFAGGCHAAAVASGAPLLFFLNPDTRLAPGCVDALRSAAVERPRWGAWQALVVLPGGERLNTSGGVVHWLGLAWSGECNEPVPPLDAPLREVGFASGAALVVRRDAWNAVGGFDPAYFMYGEDVDLSLRLRLAGWEIGAVPSARVEHDYTFVKGTYKWFLLERNRWWTILGAYPTPLLVLLAPALACVDLALLAVAARGGWLRAKLSAQVEVLRSLRWALARRRRVQTTRTASTRVFAAALTASLDSPYLGSPARLALVRAVQARYWRGVRALVGGSGG